MNSTKKTTPRKARRNRSRVPENSIFYAKIIPALLIGLGIVMVVLILIAAGVLLGIIPFR